MKTIVEQLQRLRRLRLLRKFNSVEEAARIVVQLEKADKAYAQRKAAEK